MKTAWAMALVIAASASLFPSAQGRERAPACLPTGDELAAWGLPVGDDSATVVLNSTSERTVFPANESVAALLSVISARPSGEDDVREAFDYDETTVDVCMSARRIDGRLDDLLLALALGTGDARNLVDLSQQITIVVASATQHSHRVTLDERLALPFLVLAGPDASWKDVANVTDTRRESRVMLSTPRDAPPQEILARAMQELELAMHAGAARTSSASTTKSRAAIGAPWRVKTYRTSAPPRSATQPPP